MKKSLLWMIVMSMAVVLTGATLASADDAPDPKLPAAPPDNNGPDAGGKPAAPATPVAPAAPAA